MIDPNLKQALLLAEMAGTGIELTANQARKAYFMIQEIEDWKEISKALADELKILYQKGTDGSTSQALRMYKDLQGEVTK